MAATTCLLYEEMISESCGPLAVGPLFNKESSSIFFPFFFFSTVEASSTSGLVLQPNEKDLLAIVGRYSLTNLIADLAVSCINPTLFPLPILLTDLGGGTPAIVSPSPDPCPPHTSPHSLQEHLCSSLPGSPNTGV